MPTCPICHSDLPKPPEDVQDWFRCQTCGTPLRLPSAIGKFLFAVSIGFVLVGIWSLEFLAPRLSHFPAWGGFLHGISNWTIEFALTILSGFLAHLLWKSSLFRPRPYEPYSSLNLSDDRTKLRGNR